MFIKFMVVVYHQNSGIPEPEIAFAMSQVQTNKIPTIALADVLENPKMVVLAVSSEPITPDQAEAIIMKLAKRAVTGENLSPFEPGLLWEINFNERLENKIPENSFVPEKNDPWFEKTAAIRGNELVR